MLTLLLAGGGLFFAGCRGVSTPAEKIARHDFAAVTEKYRPRNLPVALPKLTADSSLSNLVVFALLNSLPVAAAYYDWAAAVENITVARSLPDPQITFQSDIADIVTSVMPGFLQTFPGPGKLKVRARAAGAASEAKYVAFAIVAQQAAFNLQRAYFQLGQLAEQLRLQREIFALLENQERVLRAKNLTGAASLPEVLRTQSERERLRTEIANLEAALPARRENFKAALGLSPAQAAPPVPSHFEFSAGNFDADALEKFALAHNPQLAAMAADVRAAEAGIAVAYKERVPDFNLGLMADVKASPVFFRPLAGLTLPIWRDKLAAEIAQAQANKLAAQARWQAAEIDLAVSFAEKLLAVRETQRKLALLENELLPKARQSLEIMRASYQTGAMDFANLTDAERIILDLQLETVAARTERELALAELSLTVAGVPPAGATFLREPHQP